MSEQPRQVTAEDVEKAAKVVHLTYAIGVATEFGDSRTVKRLERLRDRVRRQPRE